MNTLTTIDELGFAPPLQQDVLEDSTSDHALLEATRTGDHDAFAELLSRYRTTQRGPTRDQYVTGEVPRAFDSARYRRAQLRRDREDSGNERRHREIENQPGTRISARENARLFIGKEVMRKNYCEVVRRE